MLLTKISKMVLSLACLSFVTGVFIAQPVNASTNKNKIDIQISPVRNKITLTSGSNYTGTYKIMNVGSERFEYKVYATPYQVTDENYTPNYSSENNYTQIAKWITFDRKTGTLEPDQSVEVTYTVSVPSDVPSGGQYAVLMNETSTSDSSATINTNTRVGLTLYSKIEGGTTRRCGKILNNKISGFLFTPPIQATSLVENCGNVDEDAKYILRVKPFFSNEPIYTNEEKPQESPILPETKRFNTVKWDQSPAIGIFKVEQIITAFGETSTAESLVFIIPLWLIIILIIFIGAVVFRLVFVAKSNKK